MKINMVRFSFLIIMLLLVSCSQASPALLTTASSPEWASTTPLTFTQSPIDTPIPSPSSSPTPALVLPLALGTQLPQLSAVITSDTINSIVEIARLGGQAVPVWTIAFAPDGRILAAAGSENTVKLWDGSSAGDPKTLSGHSDLVTSIAFSADSTTLASGSRDNTVKLWDTATGQELRTFSAYHPDAINSYGVIDIAFSPDGRFLAAVSETLSSSTSNFFFNMDLWDVASGALVHTWGEDYIWGFAFSPDGKLLAWGKGTQYMTNKVGNNVILSDVTSGRVIRTLSGHTARVTSVAFSPDGNTIVSGSEDGTIRTWDVASGSQLLSISNTVNSPSETEYSEPVKSVTFSPDGKTLVSGADQGGFGVYSYTIKLWDATSGQKLGSIGDYSDLIIKVIFSPDGKLIASNSGDGIFRLWGVYP